MNKQEIAALLTVASGFDRRVVDAVTVESWALVPEITSASFEAARAIVVDHQTNMREYMTVAHVVAGLRSGGRQTRHSIEADVRSAKARGLLERAWPASKIVPVDVADALHTLRELERRAASERLALDQIEGSPVDVGDVGRDAL